MVKRYSALPERLFMVRVPYICTLSEEEHAILGVPVNTKPNGRQGGIDEQLVQVMLPLTKIIDIYASGSPIYLINYKEVLEIYKILESYLVDTTSNYLEFNAPVYEDNRDIDIDKFAQEVFELNRYSVVTGSINKRSGFDIGVSNLDVSKISSVRIVRGNGSILANFRRENPMTNAGFGENYITNEQETIDPEKVTRAPRVRRRIKYTGNGNEQ